MSRAGLETYTESPPTTMGITDRDHARRHPAVSLRPVGVKELSAIFTVDFDDVEWNPN